MTWNSLRAAVLCLAPLTLSSALAAQEAPPTPKPAPTVVAGIPVNYDEAKVGIYTLPDALVLDSGKPVRDAKAWTKKRRPEIVSLFETQQYGKAPGRPPAESFDVFDKGTPALNGKAIRKQVMIYLTPDHTGPAIQLLMYLPAGVTKPVPMFLSINFGAVQNAVDDPGIKPETVWNPRPTPAICHPQAAALDASMLSRFSMPASASPPSTMATSTLIT